MSTRPQHPSPLYEVELDKSFKSAEEARRAQQRQQPPPKPTPPPTPIAQPPMKLLSDAELQALAEKVADNFRVRLAQRLEQAKRDAVLREFQRR